MVNPIDIQNLTLEELSGVIALYPWYAGARMEQVRRMSGLGALSDTQIAETALHLGHRKPLTDLLRAGRSVDCSDKDARQIMESFIPRPTPEAQPPRVFVVGGDYFTQTQYEGARHDDDGIFSKFATKARAEGYHDEPAPEPEDFCTETLAGIYLEQGYKEEALDIYSKLILRYPEKSVYFAALIDEINKKDN